MPRARLHRAGYPGIIDASCRGRRWAEAHPTELFLTLQDGTDLDLSKDGDHGVLEIKRPGEAVVKVTYVERYKHFEIKDDKQPIGEFDRLDGPAFDTFVEEKDGRNIENPLNEQPIGAWVMKEIWYKTDKRIKNLALAVRTAKAPGYVGPASPPPLSYLRTVRKFRFEFRADGPELKAAVEVALGKLRETYGKEGYSFEAVYGVP